MRERKFVKFRVDMYSDTKFKIIDKKPERDLIHYVWSRVVVLCGKVNLEGNLYLSKNIPYTIETLAIEFNRSEDQIKLALEVFIELEMIEIIDGRIYRVKNFAKHQNIKVKESVRTEDREYNLKNLEGVVKETSQNETCDEEEKKVDNKYKESQNNVDEEETTFIENDCGEYKENIYTGINEVNNISSEIVDDSFGDNIQITLETRKSKKGKGKKKKKELFNMTDGEDIDGKEMISLTEEERPLGEGDQVILEMTF